MLKFTVEQKNNNYVFIFCTKSILHRAPYLTVQNLDVLAQHKLNLKLDVIKTLHYNVNNELSLYWIIEQYYILIKRRMSPRCVIE